MDVTQHFIITRLLYKWIWIYNILNNKWLSRADNQKLKGDKKSESIPSGLSYNFSSTGFAGAKKVSVLSPQSRILERRFRYHCICNVYTEGITTLQGNLPNPEQAQPHLLCSGGGE